MKKRIAIALTIIMVISIVFSAFAAGGTWKQNSKGWWYSYSSGGYARNKWEQIDGKWYHFDSSGYMQTGWQNIGGKWYYLAKSGKMQTGWQKVSGKWYYLGSNGAMTTGWQKVSGKWYYMSGGGVMQTGWQKVSGKWYYLGTNGAMQTGWLKLIGKWYYLGKNGVMVTGKQTIGGKTYYFGSNGVWQSDDASADYDSYLGEWFATVNGAGTDKETAAVEFHSFDGNKVVFEVSKFLYTQSGYGVEDYSAPKRMAFTYEMTGTVKNNTISFSYEDSYGNPGTGTIKLDGSRVYLSAVLTKWVSPVYGLQFEGYLKKR